MVILDTSSIVNFVTPYGSKVFPIDYTNMPEIIDGIVNTIESIVLYDEIYVDSHSINRNKIKYPIIDNFVNFFSINLINNYIEVDIYDHIIPMLGSIISTPKSKDLFRTHINRWMTDEIGVREVYPSTSWGEVEKLLPDTVIDISKILKTKLEIDPESTGAACIVLLRTFYYFSLQHLLKCDLILHPMKANYIESDPGSFETSIIDIFDKEVRAKFYDRKNKWLNTKDASFKIPMLAYHIIKQSQSWDDMILKIKELRDSKEAVKFRKGIRSLKRAFQSNDNLSMDQLFSPLNEAAEIWSQNIAHGLKTRTVNITLPIINISTDFSIREPRIFSDSGQQVLLFIHKLLRYS